MDILVGGRGKGILSHIYGSILHMHGAELRRAKIELAVNKVRFIAESLCFILGIKRNCIKLNITGQFRGTSNLVKR